MKNEYLYKIKIDFEYMNEIYTIISEPYQTLFELKENVIKKIFPPPKNIHCFYRNIDIFDKEDEQISQLFPFKKIIKIRLKNPSKEKNIIKPYKSYKYLQSKTKSNLIDTKEIQPKIELNSNSSVKFKKKIKIKNKYIKTDKNIKNNILFSNLLDHHKERKKSQEVLETIEDDIYKNDDLFYYLHKNKIKKLLNNNDNNNDNYKENNNNKDISSEDNSNYNTEREPKKKLKKLSFNIKEIKNINNKKCITQREIDENKISKFELNYGIINENNSEKNIDISEDSKILEENNNNINNNPINNDTHQNQIKEDLDENYLCLLCKKNMITNYCTKCNKFICNNCLEKCKIENHDSIEIKNNEDCLSNINIYGLLIISNIEKKVNNIQDYENELKIYDIKKKRDDLISMFNEIINLYSQITQILKIIYKEKDIKNAITKYKLDSDNIKGEINDIINKAESYIKSDKNNSQPKYKIMNMQYFFGLINEKQNNHQLITEKMNVYSLNTNINSNIDKSFNEIEDIMKKLINKENSFELKDNLKVEYDKLIKEYQNMGIAKDKKKMFFKRKSVMNINKIHIPNFPSIVLSNKK